MLKLIDHIRLCHLQGLLADTMDAEDSDDDDDNEKCEEEEGIDLSSIQLQSDLSGPVDKVRKIVKYFRKSAKQNGFLQDKVKLKRGGKQVGDKVVGGEELQLPREVKTRWNSLLLMIQAFLRIKVPVEQTLSESGKLHMVPTEDEYKVISDLANALTVFEIITLELSKRDANIAQADREFEWALMTLKSFKTSIANRLYQSLYTRITERRQKDLSTLLGFLENPKFFAMLKNDKKHLTYSSKKEIAKAALDLYLRLYSHDDAQNEENHEVVVIEGTSNENAENVDDPAPVQGCPPPFKKSLYEDHNKYQRSLAQPPKEKPFNSFDSREVLSIIKKEMVLYEDTGNRGKILEKIYNALKGIPPTSTEAEGRIQTGNYFLSCVHF